jgi:hypothetical protein
VTAVQIPMAEFVRWAEPPALSAELLEQLGEHEVEQLLVARFRAFLRRDLSWRSALLLAVTPEA